MIWRRRIGDDLTIVLPARLTIGGSRIVPLSRREEFRPGSDRDPKTVVLVDPGLVGAACDVAPPILVIEVPAYRLSKPALEIDAASLAEIVCELAGVDGVAVVVTGTVGDVVDQRSAGTPCGGRA